MMEVNTRTRDLASVMRKSYVSTRCSICGSYFAITDESANPLCLDPQHWLAAGLVAARDFYWLTQIVARARYHQQYFNRSA